jgi:hypothetical protein
MPPFANSQLPGLVGHPFAFELSGSANVGLGVGVGRIVAVRVGFEAAAAAAPVGAALPQLAKASAITSSVDASAVRVRDAEIA